MTRLLVLRPQPGAQATIAAAHALGWETIAAPLFTLAALDWSAPASAPEAVLMTSASAARLGGPQLSALKGLPLYAVGEATARAARAAGFTTVIAGTADADAIVARAVADGVTGLLHLAGRDHRPFAAPIPIERRLVYSAEPVEALPDTARAALPGAIALVHSPRAAALFRRLALARFDAAAIAIAAISPAAARAAGEGWRASAIAAAPTNAALLAAAAKLCDHGAG